MSFDSYIKPQPATLSYSLPYAVCLLIPTSNHNVDAVSWKLAALYVFWFLHQTTTCWPRAFLCISCMSFDSYIKPQHAPHCPRSCWAVCLLIPTSNHNLRASIMWKVEAVCLLIPTSNHNQSRLLCRTRQLYVFWFLHQTTTSNDLTPSEKCCMSFDSYIKPQPLSPFSPWSPAVCLLIPTSNHNY